MEGFAKTLKDALEVIITVVIILLAIIGILTLVRPEMREPFFEFMLNLSDAFKNLFR